MNRQKRSLAKRSCFLGTLFFFSISAIAAEKLSFDEFKTAIEINSVKISSLKNEERGAGFETAQARFLTTPQAFVDAQTSRDKSPVLAPEFSGTDRNGDVLRLGLQSQTSFGLKPRVFAFTENQNVSGVSSLPNPNLRLSRKGYGVESEVSLWKNALGRDVRGQRDSLVALSESKRHLAEASLESLKVEAEGIYFEAVFLKEAILIQQELIRQGERLVSWTKNQSNNRLLEPVHVAQAMASHQARKISLISMSQQLRANLYKISQLCGRELAEDIQLESIDTILGRLSSPQGHNKQKITIKALAKAVESERISIELAKENFKPDLSLKAQYLTFTNDGRNDDTARCQSREDCRTLNVSLNFTFPLDMPSKAEGALAANTRIEGLKKNLEAEVQNSQVELRQIEAQAKAFKDQIESFKTLIEAQELRLKKERERQSRGRATTFDLIISEQDLGESKINLAEAKMRYASTISQFKLFEEGK